MNHSSTIRALLAVSVCANLALVALALREPASATQAATDPAPPSETPLVAPPPDPRERAPALRSSGLADEEIHAALVPAINRRLIDSILEKGTWEDRRRAVSQARQDRAEIMEALFGRRKAERWDEAMHLFRHAFPEPALNLRLSFDTEEDKNRHRILGAIGGVALDQEQKAALVEIVQQHGEDREMMTAELTRRFDEETANRILQGQEPGFARAYKRSLTLGDDASERHRAAQALHEITRTRKEAIDHWKSATISEAERSAGIRTVETESLQLLREAIGEPAVEFIGIDGW